MDRKTVRINPNGSKEEVPWTKLKVGDGVEEDGVRKRIITKTMFLEQLDKGHVKLFGKWWEVTNRGIASEGNFYRPLNPPDSPFGEPAGEWDIAPPYQCEALSFEDVQ